VKIGDQARCSRSFSAADVRAYAQLSRHTVTGDRVPEPLIGSLFSCLLGVELPGFGTQYLKQETRFHQPARVGDRLTARVEITRMRPDKQLVDLATTCADSAGNLVASGRALVYVGDAANGPG
jgi:acyl dehydratase